MPTIRKDRDGRWMGRVILDGQVVETRLFGSGAKYGKEWQAAKTWEIRRKEEVVAQKAQTCVSVPGLLAWLVPYLEDVQRRQSTKTFDEKKSVANRFMAHAGTENVGGHVQDLTPAVALSFLQKQYDARSGYAANKDRKNLGAAWEWGRVYVPGFPLHLPNPFHAAHRFPEKRRPRYVPSAADFWQAYDQTEGQDRVMLTAFYYLAARKNELFSLTWADVDFTGEGRVRLWTKKTRDGSPRGDWLPMLPELRRALAWWRGEHPTGKGHVFIVQNVGDATDSEHLGQPFKARQHYLRKLCKRAGVTKFDFHAIRHRRAVDLYEAGNRLGMIQRWLRHGTASTTERYLKRLGLDLDCLRGTLELTSNGPAKVIPFAGKEKAPRMAVPGASGM